MKQYQILRLFFLFVCLFVFGNIYSQIFNTFKNKKILEIEIIKIDSTQDYYIIYANSNNLHLKIITRKYHKFERNIELSKKYLITIASLNDNLPEKIKLNNPCDVDFGFEDGNCISNDSEYNCEIYFAYEILGLFYSTNKKEMDEYYNYIENNPLKAHKRIKQ